MHPRTHLAIITGKLTRQLLKLAGRGGGTLPGLVAEKIDPTILTALGRQCSGGITVISGTNVKTTTSRMVADMLEAPLVHNRSGSNLIRGHIAAFLEQSSWSGTLKAKSAVLEVDEAVLPRLLTLVSPRIVLLHNLFRDQLDRYGEVDSLASKWTKALTNSLPDTCQVIINGDDPNLAYLGNQLPTSQVAYYGIGDASVGTKQPVGVLDAYLSPASGTPLTYRHYFLSHLGDYYDPQGFKRPELAYAATSIKLGTALKPTEFTVGDEGYRLPLPGLYSVYNALAAITVGQFLSIPVKRIQTSIGRVAGAFGRYEQIQIGASELVLCLIKNPAGATEILKTIAQSEEPYNLALFLNDNFADGLDVSWYWDTPYELLASGKGEVSCAGIRAADGALRLKYAGFTQPISRFESLSTALDSILSRSGRTYILSTYTATLELQTLLTKRGIRKAYWQE